MRIALLHPFSWPEVRRGGERYCHDLAWWLSGAGHEVDYVTGGRRHEVERVDGARLVRLAHPHPRRLDARVTRLDSFGAAALPWLAAHRYDIVHAMVPTAALAARLTAQRCVYTAIGHPRPLLAPERRKDRAVLRQAIRRATIATALSASAADSAWELAGRRPQVLTPGVRLDVFTSNLRARTGPPRLLFPADANDRRKRLAVALAAMPAVLGSLPDARLVVAGGGALPDGLPDAVRRAVDVVGLGEVGDLAARYQNATVTVLPSLDEAFGLVLVESLACGTPVVASRSGGMPEIVASGVGGLATPDDPTALAAAIIEAVALARDPATPHRCAEHAAQWGWDVVGPRHVAAYREATRTRKEAEQ